LQQAISAGNLGAALVFIGEPERAAAQLRTSLTAATRVGDVSIQIEGLLRLAAAEAALGHRTRAATLYRSWLGVMDAYEEEVTESNQRIVDTFLADLLPQTAVGDVATVELADAVAVALGEQPNRTRAGQLQGGELAAKHGT